MIRKADRVKTEVFIGIGTTLKVHGAQNFTIDMCKVVENHGYFMAMINLYTPTKSYKIF